MRRFALLGLLALAVSGCMGDDDGGLSREDYVARADGICGDAQVRLSQLPRPITGDPAELELYLGRALPIARRQLEDLRELPLPGNEDDRAQITQLLDLLEQELNLNEAAGRAAEQEDRAAVQTALQQAAAISAEAGQLSEQLEFVVCARRL